MLRVCVPITASSVEDAKQDIAKAESKADLLELRVDFLTEPTEENILEVMSACSKPYILTFRSKEEGGKADINEEERLATIRSCLRQKPTYVDLELKAMESNPEVVEEVKRSGAKLVSSFHDFNSFPPREELLAILEKQESLGADVCKAACMANSEKDALTALNCLSDFLSTKQGREAIVLAMGKPGVITRVVGPLLGAHLTFASLSRGKESAPGQLSVDEVKQMWQMMGYVVDF